MNYVHEIEPFSTHASWMDSTNDFVLDFHNSDKNV